MNIVKDEFFKIFPYVIPMVAILYGIFALFGYYDLNVAVSMLIGMIYSAINFLMIGSVVQAAVKKPLGKAQSYIAVNYIIRYILTGEIIYLAIKIPYLNPLAVVLPMFFPKLVLVGRSIFQGKEVK